MRLAGSNNQAWANSLNRRNAFRAVAGFLAGSPLLRAAGSVSRPQPRSRTEGTGHGLRFRAGGLRQSAPLQLRLHGVRNRRRVHAAPQSRGVRLGRADSESRARRQPDPDGHRDPRHEDGFPDHGVAVGRPHRCCTPMARLATYQGATAASNTPYHREQRLQLPVREDRGGGQRSAVVPALSEAGAQRQSRSAGARAGRRRQGRRRDDRSAGGRARARAARPQSRTPAAGDARRRAAPKNPYRLPENRLFYNWKFFDEIRPIVQGPDAGEGNSHRRRREAVPRARRGRHLCLEPRRPLARLQPVDAGSAARDRRRGGRQGPDPVRQRRAPRHRRAQGARAGRERGLPGPRVPAGAWAPMALRVCSASWKSCRPSWCRRWRTPAGRPWHRSIAAW